MIKEQNARQSTMNVFDFYADIYSLYGLAYACPYLDRKGDCPLKAIERYLLSKMCFGSTVNVLLKGCS
jgi:hypothetical protein